LGTFYFGFVPSNNKENTLIIDKQFADANKINKGDIFEVEVIPNPSFAKEITLFC